MRDVCQHFLLGNINITVSIEKNRKNCLLLPLQKLFSTSLIGQMLGIYIYCIVRLSFLADTDSEKFQLATARFKRLFGMPDAEKLVNCKYICKSIKIIVPFR